MMALLNKPEARYVLPLLIELAKRYPQALYYPFKISSETLNPTSADIQQLVTQLRTLLTTNPLLDMWVHQLERLTHPEHRWKDWTDTLKHLMSQEPRNVPAIQRVWIQMWNDCLDAKQPYLGTYNKQFALTYGKLVENLFGKDGSKLVTLDLPSFNKILTDLNEKMRKNLSGNQTVKQKLTEFSLWLARFEQSDYSADWVYMN
jgi:DNA-dependent protein kinase catalytic subunit